MKNVYVGPRGLKVAEGQDDIQFLILCVEK